MERLLCSSSLQLRQHISHTFQHLFIVKHRYEVIIHFPDLVHLLTHELVLLNDFLLYLLEEHVDGFAFLDLDLFQLNQEVSLIFRFDYGHPHILALKHYVTIWIGSLQVRPTYSSLFSVSSHRLI